MSFPAAIRTDARRIAGMTAPAPEKEQKPAAGMTWKVKTT